LTDTTIEPPWGWGPGPTAEERAEWARRDAVASDHYYQVPARDAAERAEYDQIEQAERQAEEDHERYVHFNGNHVQDPPAHGEHCVDSCPYDTDEQAQQRAERHAYAEAQEAAERSRPTSERPRRHRLASRLTTGGTRRASTGTGRARSARCAAAFGGITALAGMAGSLFLISGVRITASGVFLARSWAPFRGAGKT